MDIVIEFGKIYDLSEKQTRILKALEFEDLTARKLSKQTQIPIGRIYEYINNLFSLGLISKSKKKPAVYSFSNKEDKIQNFIKNKFKETAEKEARVLSILEKSPGEVKLLTAREDYILESRRIYDEEDKFFFIERAETVPFYFYPEDDEDYKRVRKFIKKKRELTLGNDSLEKLYKDNYFCNLKKDKKFISITNLKSINKFFEIMKRALGEEKFKKNVRRIIRLIESKNIHCKIVKEEYPYYLVITKNLVLICFFTSGKVINLLIRDKGVAEQFIVFFENSYRNADYAAKFLKKSLKER